jgi:hypothetical protein
MAKKSLMQQIVFIIALAAILFLPGQQSVQAQSTSNSLNLPPGVYTGWVFFSARLYSEMTVSGMQGWVAEYWQAHGDLKAKINKQGPAEISIVVPTEITLSDYVTIKGQGTCTATTSAVGETSYTGNTPLTDSFLIPISLLPELGLSTITSESYGSMPKCENAAAANGNAMWKGMKATTSLINSLQFQVGNQTKIGANGTCTILGWEGTTPVPGGQGTRTLETCNWVIYWVPQSGSQEGWK